jgi:hypothetical protein
MVLAMDVYTAIRLKSVKLNGLGRVDFVDARFQEKIDQNHWTGKGF